MVFALDNFAILQLPKTAGYFITNPIVFSLYRTKQSLSKQLHFILAARFSAQENTALAEQIAQLLSENAQLRQKLAETEVLLSQERSLDPKTYNAVPARPIGFDRYLRVDKGSNDGIFAGQAVVFKDNFIGQVVDVAEKSANIKLLVDPDSKIAAFSFGKNGKAKGILIGQFGSQMLLDKILHEEPIEKGDLVYSEGTEGYLPRGLILGRVLNVKELENEVFKQAEVSPMFDIRDLELVFLLKD